MSSLSPFDFINAISQSKENLMVGTDNDNLAEKEYDAYLVNKGLKHAILYVDADNEKGLKLYDSLGFN